MSGIEPSPDLFNVFNEMKLRSKYKYVTFSLTPAGVDSANKKVWGWTINSTVAAGGAGGGASAGRGAAGGRGGQPAQAEATVPGASPLPTGARAGQAGDQAGSTGPVATAPAVTPIPAAPTKATAAPAATGGHDSAEDNAAAWRDMVTSLPDDQGRFVLFDWRAKAPDGRILAKVVLVKWCPDHCDVQTKMIMGSSYPKLKETLVGLGRDIQAADRHDLEFNAVAQAVGQA